MPTPIQCSTCLHTLSVDDALRGKTTPCPRCSAEIQVPETFAVAEESPDPNKPPLEELADTPGEACPLCGTTVPANVLLCPACSFDCRTAMPPEKEIPSDPTYVHRTPRRSLLAALSTFDTFLSAFVFFILLAGCALWGVHISSQPGGFYFRNLLPALFMLAAVFLFITPLAALAIRITRLFLRGDPPDAIYRRAATVLTLPVALNLFSTGEIPLKHLDTRLVIPVWIVSLALFAYLFRAPFQKLLATLLAFMIALVIAWSLLTTAALTFPTVGESLYKDMSPPGLFEQFAAGQSPPPEIAATIDPVAATQAATLPREIQQLAREMAPEPSPLEPEVETPPPTQPQVNVPLPPSPSIIHHPAAITPVAPPHPAARTDVPAVTLPLATGSIPIKIITHPDLQNVRSLVMNAMPSRYMLIIKSGDGEAIAQRWKIEPLQNAGEVRFSELPKQPNDYALNPSGTTLITLSHFPHNQLIMTTFDNDKITTRKIPLDRKEWIFTPTLIGFVDPTHFLLRWNESDLLQVWSTDGVMSASTRTRAFSDNLSLWAINPNPLRGGPGVAVVMRGTTTISEQLVVCRLQGWQLIRRISPMDRPFITSGLAFSPDGSALALCSSTAGGASILAFDLTTGENTVSATFSTDLLAANIRLLHHHGLLWGRSNQWFLAAGNELFSAATGKHLGSLGLTNIEDAYSADGDSVVFLQSTGDTHRVFVAKIAIGKPAEAYEKH